MTNPTPDVNALIERLEESAEHLRVMPAQNGRQDVELSWASSRLSSAAQALRTLQARVGELTEVATWLAGRRTVDEVMNGTVSSAFSKASPEERIRLIGERKREHDDIVRRARTLTSQEAQRHGE